MARLLRWTLLALLFAAAAFARAGAPPHIEQQLTQARLAGAATFSWFGFKLYEAQLWVGDKGYQGEAAPFALDLRYLRKLDGLKIAEASVDQMEKIGAGSPAQRQLWLTRMRALFPNVGDGTHLTGVFELAGGVRFYLDGKPLGTIDDREFAHAFAAIWLDPATTAPALRRALLKDAAPR
jgi:hypothetical protein